MSTSSTARRLAAVVSIAVSLLVLLPAPVVAQGPVASFDQLNARLKIGDTVWVTDARGREIKGKLTEMHDSSITVRNNGQTTMSAEHVRLVERASKSLGRAALWGAGIGAAAEAVAGGATKESCEMMCGAGPGAVVGAALGAALGAAVRAVLPAGRTLVYRAPSPSGSAPVSIAPVITPRTTGVAVTYSF